MKAAVVEQPGRIRIWDVKPPEIDDYEAVVEMRACGLCNSTDLKIFQGHFPGLSRYPLVLGHEGAGEVVELGKKVKSFKVGDMVLEPWAKIRDEGLSSGFGGFAEYAVVRDRLALAADGLPWNPVLARQQVVPKDIDPVEATVLITLKEALSGLINFGLKEGMAIAIFGDGPVGAALVRFARILHAGRIVGIGHWDARIEVLKAMSADLVINEKRQNVAEVLKAALGERPFDLVVDAVGRNRIVNDALGIVRPGGKVGMYGVAADQEFTIPLASWPNNVCLHKLFLPAKHEDVHDRVIDYVRKGAVRLQDFYSHVMDLEEIETGLELIQARKAFKILFRISR